MIPKKNQSTSCTRLTVKKKGSDDSFSMDNGYFVGFVDLLVRHFVVSVMWGSSRPSMPANWPVVRRKVLRLSDVCYLCGTRGADEVDHVIPRHKGGGDSVDNLRPVHRACHAKKSSAEGVNRQRELRDRRRRPAGRHPGAM